MLQTNHGHVENTIEMILQMNGDAAAVATGGEEQAAPPVNLDAQLARQLSLEDTLDGGGSGDGSDDAAYAAAFVASSGSAALGAPSTSRAAAPTSSRIAAAGTLRVRRPARRHFSPSALTVTPQSPRN